MFKEKKKESQPKSKFTASAEIHKNENSDEFNGISLPAPTFQLKKPSRKEDKHEKASNNSSDNLEIPNNINIHKDSSESEEMDALAFTQGNDIHFAPGQFNLNTRNGQELMGHEMQHVVQQSQGKVKPTGSIKGKSVNEDPLLESEADEAGRKFAYNGEMPSDRSLSAPNSVLQKKGGPEVKGKAPAVAISNKKNLKQVFVRALSMSGNDLELAYDQLAVYIASQTKQKRKRSALAISTEDSMRIEEDAEAMKFLGDIGYWDDLPRRKAKAANEMYDKFSYEEGGKSKRRTDKDNSDETKDLLGDIISVTTSDSEKRRGILVDKAMGKKYKKSSTGEYIKSGSNYKKDPKLGKRYKKDGESYKKSKTGSYLMASGGKYKLDSRQRYEKDNFAWSATTISKIHHMAGMGDTFAYAESHYAYSKAAKENKKENRGIEKLYRAFDKKDKKGNVTEAAAKVALGDTLIRGRDKKQATYDKIPSKTHGDVVSEIVILDKDLNKLGNYTALKSKHDQEQSNTGEETKPVSFGQHIMQNKYRVFAIVIGGNTSDNSIKKVKGKNKFQKNASDTVGKNYVELNADLTIMPKKGRNNQKYKSKEAYYGVQKSNTSEYKADKFLLEDLMMESMEEMDEDYASD